jgi:hypothetical protein
MVINLFNAAPLLLPRQSGKRKRETHSAWPQQTHATTRAKTQKRIRVWRSGSFDGALVAAAFSFIRRLINSHYSSTREMNVVSNWITNGLKRPLENGAHGPTKQNRILCAFEEFSQWILSELCKLISGY